MYGILGVFLLQGAKGGQALRQVFVLFQSGNCLLLTVEGKGRGQCVEAAWLPAVTVPHSDSEEERLERCPEWIVSVVKAKTGQYPMVNKSGTQVAGIVPLRCAKAGRGRWARGWPAA